MLIEMRVYEYEPEDRNVKTRFNLPKMETRPVSEWSLRELKVERNHLTIAVRRDPCKYNKRALVAVETAIAAKESK